MKLFARRFPGEIPHVPFLSPWWGAPREDASSLHRGQFDAWAADRTHRYVLVERPEDADIFVLAISWKHTRANEQARAFAQSELADAHRLGKRIVIFFDSDHDEPMNWPAHAIVFRFSLYSDTRQPNEFAIPTFSQDFLEQNFGGRLQLRPKNAVPSVGFCGYAPPLGCSLSKNTLREVARYLGFRAGLFRKRRELIAHAARVQAIRHLRRTPGVDGRFILRDQFAFNRWGVLQPGGTPETAARQRREFIENLDTCDYALSVRGLANCSIRFYEAISLGRIPLFINTQCVLPYDKWVDWRSACLWVEDSDLPRLGRIVAGSHAALTPEAFAEKQKQCRALFEKWIRPKGFFRELWHHWAAD
jgi:hypothetical protein